MVQNLCRSALSCYVAQRSKLVSIVAVGSSRFSGQQQSASGERIGDGRQLELRASAARFRHQCGVREVSLSVLPACFAAGYATWLKSLKPAQVATPEAVSGSVRNSIK